MFFFLYSIFFFSFFLSFLPFLEIIFSPLMKVNLSCLHTSTLTLTFYLQGKRSEMIWKKSRYCYARCMSVWSAMIKIPQIGGISNRNLFSHSAKARKCMMKVPASLVPGEGSLPGLYMAAFQLSSNSGTEREEAERENSVVIISLFIRTVILWDQGLSFMNSFNLNYLLIGPISKCSPTGIQDTNMDLGVQFGPQHQGYPGGSNCLCSLSVSLGNMLSLKEP